MAGHGDLACSEHYCMWRLALRWRLELGDPDGT